MTYFIAFKIRHLPAGPLESRIISSASQLCGIYSHHYYLHIRFTFVAQEYNTITGTIQRLEKSRMSLQKNLLAASILCACTTAASGSTSPNILLIIADDMGLDSSPCHSVGNNHVTMPNLQSLCEQGMVFDNAYSAPVCSPTRASILTGKYGFRTGVGAAIPRSGGAGLSSDEVSIFDRLNETEYSSAVVGKWHVAGSDAGLNHPATLGVDEFYGFFKGGTPDYFKWKSVHNGKTEIVNEYSTTVLTNHAIDWVGAQQDPWFLWLAYNAPHTPFHLPPEGLHTNSELTGNRSDIRRNPLPYYNAALEALDTEMGRLLDSLTKETRDNTVVLFMGDNGTPGRVASDIYGNRGAKGSIFNGGVNIPLVVQGPNVLTGRSDALINTTDIHATIASIAGISSDAPDAFDFAPALLGKATDRTQVYVEHFSDKPVRGRSPLGWSLRDAQYKLVALDDTAPMLFNLATDPFEKHDLLAAQPNDAERAKATELLMAHQKLTQ